MKKESLLHVLFLKQYFNLLRKQQQTKNVFVQSDEIQTINISSGGLCNDIKQHKKI